MAFSSPRITPYLLYEDLGGALAWLAKAFGMRERSRRAGPDNGSAVVLEEPADQAYGDRRCGVEDPEGHQWYFAQTINISGKSSRQSSSGRE